MKIVCWSDRHRRTPELPDGDLMIFAGDMCDYGTLDELEATRDFLLDSNYEKIICIAGNHDICLEKQPEEARAILKHKRIIYLENELIEYHGLKIFGSPITPIFMNWSFMQDWEERQKHWKKIHNLKLDVLITHSPPAYILDQSYTENCGCEHLRVAVEKIKPKLHVFGHIHEACGKTSMKEIVESRGGKWTKKDKDTIFVNAFEPITIEL